MNDEQKRLTGGDGAEHVQPKSIRLPTPKVDIALTVIAGGLFAFYSYFSKIQNDIKALISEQTSNLSNNLREQKALSDYQIKESKDTIKDHEERIRNLEKVLRRK